MIILDVEQGSEEWHAARCGVLSASIFDKAITSKGTLSTQNIGLMNQLIAEKFTNQREIIKSNDAMLRGVELEPIARECYEFITDDKVQEVGLVYKSESKDISCSPDGLVEDRGLEIKCPLAKTHVSYLLANKLPTKYIQQVQGSMWVTGLDKWDFMSYHPELPPLLLTIDKDVEFHKCLDKVLNDFISKLKENLEKIKSI